MITIKILNGSKQVTNFPDGLAVWCDRRSALGNPFELGSKESRDDVCDAYQDYFEQVVHAWDPMQAASPLAEIFGLTLAKAWKQPTRDEFMAALEDLESVARDVNRSCRTRSLGLACWCHPKRCHCDTIAAYLMGRLEVSAENVVTQGSLF